MNTSSNVAISSQTDFSKVVRIGTSKTYGGRGYSIFCKISFKDGRLSISGVEGPLTSGNSLGGSGQIYMHLRDAQSSITLAPGWNRKMLSQFFKVWQDWHLNDMKAGTPEQMAVVKNMGYTEAIAALEEKGLLIVNGYKYGSAWLKVEVPQDVLDFLQALPETDKTPAWI